MPHGTNACPVAVVKCLHAADSAARCQTACKACAEQATLCCWGEDNKSVMAARRLAALSGQALWRSNDHPALLGTANDEVAQQMNEIVKRACQATKPLQQVPAGCGAPTRLCSPSPAF